MNRQYISALLLFAAAVIVVIVLVYPTYQVTLLSSQELLKRQKEFETQSSLVQELSRLKTKYKEVEPQLSRLFTLLPALGPTSIPELFIELEGLTAQNGLLLEKVSFSLAKSPTPQGGDTERTAFKTITAQIALKGSYQGLKNFAKAVETNEHLMDIASVSLTAPKGSTEEEGEKGKESAEEARGVLSYTMSIVAYYQ